MLNFNSIKVRLERADDAATAQVNLYFNSIKVRLEQVARHEGYARSSISIP